MLGLDFNDNANRMIENLYDHNDWIHSLVFKVEKTSNTSNNPNPKINLTVDSFGLKWADDSHKSNWDSVLYSLPNNHVRYALCNFEYYDSPMFDHEVVKTKTVFIMWAPDTANVKDRMLISMHAKDVQRQIQKQGGIHMFIQANSIDDIEYETVLKKLTVCM